MSASSGYLSWTRDSWLVLSAVPTWSENWRCVGSALCVGRRFIARSSRNIVLAVERGVCPLHLSQRLLDHKVWGLSLSSFLMRSRGGVFAPGFHSVATPPPLAGKDQVRFGHTKQTASRCAGCCICAGARATSHP